jgi:hypothetical protein
MPHTPVSIHPPDQLDGAWKCALDCLLEECLTLCFPAIAAKLDLSRALTILETELQLPAAGTSPAASACHADRVLRGHARDGRRVCLHIEVQCQRDEHFAERMYVYHALLFAKYRLPVISMAILGDSCPGWRPDAFGYCFGDSALSLCFGVAKLLDLAPALPPLLAAGNGFALFATAHLETIRTKGEPFARLAAKCTLTAILCGFGWEQGRLVRMLDLLDRLMLLPPQLDATYRQHIRNLKGKHMLSLMQRLRRDEIRRVLERGTSLGMRRGVRTGRAEGRTEGRRTLLVDLMEKRFGPLPAHTIARLQAASPGEVQRWTERFCDASSLDDLLD